MTSKPASRKARAMILAPRSWPSRPGFATRMRSRFSGTLNSFLLLERSDPRRVAIHAEHLAEDVGDFTDGALLLHGIDDRRHEIGAVGGGALDGRQGGAHVRGG